MEFLVDSSAGTVIIILMILGGVVALVLGVRELLGQSGRGLRGRIGRLVGGSVETPASGLVRERRGLLLAVLGPLAKVATPTNQAELTQARSRLVHAGFRAPHALKLFAATRLLLAAGFTIGFLLLNANLSRQIPHLLELTILILAIGFYAPSVWLAGRIRERQRELQRTLPDALDLLVVCVEAGLGLDAAINRVTVEIRLASALLADELNAVASEMRAGVSGGDAFRRVAERTGVEELRALAAVIVQTQIFGTSIARSLRVQSDSMRIRRMQRAEERAAMASVKMMIPMIFCILPALFIVLVGPAAVRIYRVLITGEG